MRTTKLLSAIGLLVTGCVAGAPAQAQARRGELRGDVTDAVGVPVSRAFVLVHSEFGREADITAKLDDAGHFQIPLLSGLYDVFVAAGGFTPQCKVVEVSGDHTTTFKAMLSVDEEHQQASGPPNRSE